jgi:hypothetical protein
MRRLVIALVPALLLAAYAAPAFAEPQPSNGVSSEGRNDEGFGGGPHCHVNVVAGEHQDVFDTIAVYPSHRAHVATGLPAEVFRADPDCDGTP